MLGRGETAGRVCTRGVSTSKHRRDRSEQDIGWSVVARMGDWAAKGLRSEGSRPVAIVSTARPTLFGWSVITNWVMAPRIVRDQGWMLEPEGGAELGQQACDSRDRTPKYGVRCHNSSVSSESHCGLGPSHIARTPSLAGPIGRHGTDHSLLAGGSARFGVELLATVPTVKSSSAFRRECAGMSYWPVLPVRHNGPKLQSKLTD